MGGTVSTNPKLTKRGGSAITMALLPSSSRRRWPSLPRLPSRKPSYVPCFPTHGTEDGWGRQPKQARVGRGLLAKRGTGSHGLCRSQIQWLESSHGGVGERPKPPAWRAGAPPKGAVGSNPTPSAFVPACAVRIGGHDLTTDFVLSILSRHLALSALWDIGGRLGVGSRTGHPSSVGRASAL